MAKQTITLPGKPTTSFTATDLLAGDAIFTLEVKASNDPAQVGAHYTYRVAEFEYRDKMTGQPTGKKGISVKVLTGPRNLSDYTYAGMLDRETCEFRTTTGSKIGTDAPSIKLFCWFVQRVHKTMPTAHAVDVWLAGRCLRCGRPLTVPSSVDAHYGPICIDLM